MVNRPASALHHRFTKSESLSSTAPSEQIQGKSEVSKSFNQSLDPSREWPITNFSLALQEISENRRSIAEQITEIMEAGSRLAEDIAQTMDALARINTGAIWKAIHDYHKQYMHYIAEDQKVLEEQHYHLNEFWMHDAMHQIFGIHLVHPELQEEQLHGKLMSLIENEEFDDELNQYVKFSPELQARLPIVEQALEAHRNERYLVAIPSLLTQFEGLLVDYLEKKNVLAIVNNRPKQLKNLSNPKKGWLRGLKDVAGEIEASENELYGFQGLVDHVADRLADERNEILHGRKTDYDNASFSVNLIMLIAGLFNGIHMHEVSKRLSAAQARRRRSNS